MPTTCDHVWETTETAMVDVYSKEVENWVLVKDINPMSICNGCGLDIRQWHVDNHNNYATMAEAVEALSLLGDRTGCPAGHGSTRNSRTTDEVIPVKEIKTYAAELPVMKKCTLCGTTKPWSIDDISNRNIWIEHTKEVVVREAWDEKLYNKDDSYKFDEDGNETFVPAGSLIDTIHHPRRTNTEIEYFENIKTGEKIYVEISSCKHTKCKVDFANAAGKIMCIECNMYFPTLGDLYN